MSSSSRTRVLRLELFAISCSCVCGVSPFIGDPDPSPLAGLAPNPDTAAEEYGSSIIKFCRDWLYIDGVPVREIGESFVPSAFADCLRAAWLFCEGVEFYRWC